MIKIEIKDIEDMKKFGLGLGQNLRGSEVVLLRGDLGAGKTHLAQFIGKGMGIEDYITSPSFALLNIYEGPIDLYHIDAYRLDQGADLEDLGFEDYIYSQGVSLIEWPDRIRDILPEDHMAIEITKLEGQKRILKISYSQDLAYLMEGIR